MKPIEQNVADIKVVAEYFAARMGNVRAATLKVTAAHDAEAREQMQGRLDGVLALMVAETAPQAEGHGTTG